MMPDMDKVIKGLEYCTTHYNCREVRSPNCPYLDLCEPIEDATGNTLMRDALALLKDQEAVYPSWQNGKMYCGHCGSKFPPRVGMRFCHRCGVPIKLKVNDIV